MRVVVCMASGPTGERFESVLLARGHDVVRLEDVTKRQIVDSCGDVFICGDRRSIRLVRGVAPSGHILAALPKLEDRQISGALEAGAIDFLTTKAGPEELVARVTLLERLAHELGTEPGASEAIWGDVQQTVNDNLAALFGRPVGFTEEPDEPAVCARIRLTAGKDGSTMDVVVGCSKASARALLDVLAPGLRPSGSALRDVLREVANNLAGGLKHAATDESLGLTLGLPADCGPDAYSNAETAWGVALGDATLTLGLKPGQGGQRSVPVAELVPGMVLRHDVLNSAGVPFVRTGTALTERTIERLIDVLGGTFAVAVTEGPVGDMPDVNFGQEGLILFDA